MRAVARTGAQNAAAMPPANRLLVRVVALSMDQYLRERLRAAYGRAGTHAGEEAGGVYPAPAVFAAFS